MTDEARLAPQPHGLLPVGDGWFTVNVRDAAWYRNERFGASCIFEHHATGFPEVGIRLRILEPGQPNGLYHAEMDQEDFLVLSGECLLLVEEQERRLRAGDFVHCPAGTAHIFIGSGDGPCAIFMLGARANGSIVYPRSEVALAHAAGAESETASPDEAYAASPPWEPGRPESIVMPWDSE